MEIACYLGISISDFWEITPFELSMIAKGYSQRKKEDADEYLIKLENQRQLMTVQAFQISRWVWQKKVDIDKALNMKEEKKDMTDEEMLKQVKILNNLFGGKEI